MKFNRILLLITLLCLCTPAYAQHRPMLGPASESVKQRTPDGTPYYSNGFDAPRIKKTKKSMKWLANQGAGHLIDQLRAFSEELTGSPSSLPAKIDAARREQEAIWKACGGRAAQVVTSRPPSSVTVYVEPAPFSLRGYNNVTGMADGQTIRVVNVAVASLSQPRSAYLVTIDSLLRWEWGNTFALWAGYKAPNISDEIGNASPCSRIR